MGRSDTRPQNAGPLSMWVGSERLARSAFFHASKCCTEPRLVSTRVQTAYAFRAREMFSDFSSSLFRLYVLKSGAAPGTTLAAAISLKRQPLRALW